MRKCIALIARLSPHVTHDAIWLVSEFAVPDKGWRRLAARLLIRALVFCFLDPDPIRVRQIPNYAKVFNCHGFSLIDKAAISAAC